MDFRKLEAFRFAAKYGGLRHAASRLRLTIPAVSIQIKRLEEELGVELFHRLPNKLVLTGQGAALLKEADQIFECLDRVKATIAGGDIYSGAISVAMGSDLSKLFAPRIARFMASHPDVNVSMMSGSSSRGLSLVMENEVDLSIAFYRRLPGNVNKLDIGKSGLSVAYSKKHYSFPKIPTLKQIAGERVIVLRRDSTTRQVIDRIVQENGLYLGRTIEVGSCRSAVEFAALGLGIALVHTVCCGVESRSGLVHREIKPFSDLFDVAIAVKPNTLMNHLHKAFIQAITGEPLTAKRSGVKRN